MLKITGHDLYLLAPELSLVSLALLLLLLDLVVSHNLFHEISATSAAMTFRECHRILQPGGVMMHLDIPMQNGRLDLVDRFVALWQTRNNAEPCFPAFAAMDPKAGMADAGFAEEEMIVTDRRKVDGRGVWYVFGARKT